MKKTKGLLVAVMVIICMCFSLKVSAQLSKELVESLPDTTKPNPRNKQQLSIWEMAMILRFNTGTAPLEFQNKFSREVDSLATILKAVDTASLDLTLASELFSHYQKKGDLPNAIFYSNVCISKAANEKDKTRIFYYMGLKARTLSDAGKYEESLQTLFTGLEKARQLKDSGQLIFLYSAFTWPYYRLGLYDNALKFCNDIITYAADLKYTDSASQVSRKNFLTLMLNFKFVVYLNLFDNTDSLKYVNKVKEAWLEANKYHCDFRFLKIADIVDAYSKADFRHCLDLCDTALKALALDGRPPGFTNIYINKYQALSFCKLNQYDKGIPLLKQVLENTQKHLANNPQLLAYGEPFLKNIYAFLYAHYKESREFPEALYYFELNNALTDSLNILKNRGTVFETNQRYNFNEKQSEIKQLAGSNMLRKKQRDMAITATIAALLGLILITSLMISRYKKLQLKKQLAEQDAENQIERLNMASQIQIDELEEKNRIVKTEEQKRLGRELHDNLSGTLAAAKMKLENEAINISDTELQQKLKDIAEQITLAYQSTRSKSHDLYNVMNEKTDIAFSKRIKVITDNVLPDDSYKKNILIDDEVAKEINNDTKINILRIIKEALTNTLKYAKAQHVSILIYKEDHTVILNIDDDGKGFDVKTQKTGIGIRSIKDRVSEMNGKLQLTSGDKGTQVQVIIPVLQASHILS